MGSTIVCAVDMEDEGFRRPLTVGTDLAERLDRPLVVAYVAPSDPTSPGAPHSGSDAAVPGPAPAFPYPYPIAPEGPELEKVRDAARQGLERLVEQSGIDPADVEVALDATPADGLRRVAADRDAELLVVGSRGHGRIRAALLGSTSHALASEAPCPVVVVPPAD